jgi:hypothetical protein
VRARLAVSDIPKYTWLRNPMVKEIFDPEKLIFLPSGFPKMLQDKKKHLISGDPH